MSNSTLEAAERCIYRIPFEGPTAEIPPKEIVGSKAHNLMRMAACGLPVPPGFVIGTQICRDYLRRGPEALVGLPDVLKGELDRLGVRSGRQIGDTRRPLLVSVRSGSAISMPGMMETVLNIGLNTTTRQGLIRMTGNPRLAADCHVRFVQQYGEVVCHVPLATFIDCQRQFLETLNVESLDDLDTAELKHLGRLLEDALTAKWGCRLPSDPLQQATAAVEAVLHSWSSDRAMVYRKLNGIPQDLGTAVTVQAMVFGNLGPNSGAGVGFTRNPATGANELYVDYLPNAQGEDVVAGRRSAMGLDELQHRAPIACHELVDARGKLEREFADMQDFEFTVEEGRFLMLQTRSGKRTPIAALRIAHDLIQEGLIPPDVALERLRDIDIDAIELVCFRNDKRQTPLIQGMSAGTGVAVGTAVFDPARAAALRQSGTPAVLVRENADTGDIEALANAVALVTAQGARTSHAAVVARQLGKPCVVGCRGLVIDPTGRCATIEGSKIAEGEMLSVDGDNGTVYRGALEVIRSRPTELIERIHSWNGHSELADKTSKQAPPRQLAKN
jgi:pyruvate,orthophosphate dikinase